MRGIIVTQAADFAAELGVREAELSAAKAGLVAKALEIEKRRLQMLAEHLPRREVVHKPSCTCPSCGGEMRKVGGDVTEVQYFDGTRGGHGCLGTGFFASAQG